MRRWQIIAIGVIVLALIVGVSVRGGGERGEKVYVEKASRRNIESIVTANGEIDPKLKVNISAHVVGKIEKLFFKEGDLVQKGQRLVQLERATYAAMRDRSDAELANRQIEVTRARAALKNAEANFRRAQQMQSQGIQAKEIFDRASLELETARAALRSAEEGVRQARAGLAQTTEDVNRTTLVAPISGKVVSLKAQEGEVVVTGTMNNPGSVIAVIADLSEILVLADVAETEVVNVQLGQAARIRVDAIPEKVYDGRVVEIGSSAAMKPGSTSGIRYFAVKVAITQPDDKLRPGMTSQVDIVTSARTGVLAVPVQSVVEKSAKAAAAPATKDAAENDDEEDVPRKKYAFVVKDGKAEMVEVTTGVSSDTYVEILSGVREGDPIVTGPFRTLRKLKKGDRVEIQKERKSIPADEGDTKDDETAAD